MSTLLRLSLLSAIMVSCAPSQTSSNCLHSFGSSPNYTLSGMLEYSDHVCTAFADVQSVTDNSVNLLIWTAAHCTPLSVAHSDTPAQNPKLSLVDTNGTFFDSFEITDPFAQRSTSIKNIAGNTSQNPALGAYILKANKVFDFPETSVCRIDSDPSRFDDQDQRKEWAQKLQLKQNSMTQANTEFCFSPFELIAMPVTLTKNDLNQRLAGKTQVSDIWSMFTQSNRSSYSPKNRPSNEIEMQKSLMDAQMSFRFQRSAHLVDLVRWCRSDDTWKTTNPIPNLSTQDATGFCPFLPLLDSIIENEIAETYFNPDGSIGRITLAQFAQKRGYDSRTSSDSASNSSRRWLSQDLTWTGDANKFTNFVNDIFRSQSSSPHRT